ncbi:MAG: GNAT family N-acetyltransferase [Chloroflexota bacterium]
MALVVREFSADRLEECVALLADAFVTNPLHLSAFGAGRLDQNRQFFRIGLRQMFVGEAFMALNDDAVRGYIHFNPWPDCLPTPEEIPLAMTTLLKPLGEAIPQVIRWFSRWCRLDPDEPHVHLGPIGVAPAAQGRGVGAALMKRYIEHLERQGIAGYLETDRAENVEFYKKFGFVVRHEEELIGTSTWYMWRPARP